MLILRKQSWLIISLIVLIAVIGGLALRSLTRPRAVTVLQSATLYPEPRALQAFTLMDDQGKVFDIARLQGKWSVLFFGYTSCPDVCPTTLTVIKQWLDALPVQLKADTQFIFVTVDPERDNVARMHDYVNYFSSELIGVTGELPAIADMAHDIGVAFNKVPQGDSYTMDHSARLFLLNPKGERYAIFSPSINAQGYDMKTLLADYQLIRQ